MINQSKGIVFRNITFLKEEIPQINEIGDISNNALAFILKFRNNIEINQLDLKYLTNLEKLFKNIEEGREKARDYKFNGSDSKKISMYGILLKIMIFYSEENPDVGIESANNKIKNVSNYITEFRKIFENSLNPDTENLYKEIDESEFDKIEEFLTQIVETVKDLNFKFM